MTRVAFIVPCHGRLALTAVCLRQLKWTCEKLWSDVDARVVVVSEHKELEALSGELGFEHVWCSNEFLGKRWNDGFERAMRRMLCDFAMPFGSDDAIIPELVWRLPAGLNVGCSRESAVVSPDGKKLAYLNITYEGGDGVRVFPRALLEKVQYRPAMDNRKRAIDGSIRDSFKKANVPLTFEYRDIHPMQIVDFKSEGEQLTSYEKLVESFGTEEFDDPFGKLEEYYNPAFLSEVEALYR